MTIREAMANPELAYVRKRGWEECNHVELPPIVRDGFRGPWAKVGIHDPGGTIAEDLDTEVFVGYLDDGEDDWEPIDPPPHR